MAVGPLELVCPAGTLAALRVAVDAGADAVYVGFQDETNARNFPGLNFSRDELREGIAFAHGRECRVYVAINTFPKAGDPGPWHRAVDDAAALGADAVLVADIGLLDYSARRHGDSAASPVGPGLGIERRSHSNASSGFRHQASGASKGPHRPGNCPVDAPNSGGDRGIRVRWVVPDGRRPMLPFHVRHRPVAEYAWRLLAGEPRAIRRKR